MMNTAMHSSTAPRPTIELTKTKLEQLLDALMQLRWLVEDRAPVNADAVHKGMGPCGGFQCALPQGVDEPQTLCPG